MCAQQRETERQEQRVRLTKSECDSICSVIHEMVLVSLGRAKYICASLPSTPLVFDTPKAKFFTEEKKKKKKQPAEPLVEQNVL